MRLTRPFAVLFALLPFACEEALEDDAPPPLKVAPIASPDPGWAAARASVGGAIVAWAAPDGCVWSRRVDALGAPAGEPRRLVCGAALPVLDAAVSDPLRAQTLLLGRRGSEVVAFAVPEDEQVPPRPLSVGLNSLAASRGVVRGDSLYIAALTGSRGTLERGAARAVIASISLPPRPRARAEDAAPEVSREVSAGVEAPGATAVDVAHDGEAVALLVLSGGRAWAHTWPTWAPEAGVPVALPGRVVSARVTADADGLVWAVARGPKPSETRWPDALRRVEVEGYALEVAPRPEGGVWAAWRDAQGRVFARAQGCTPDPVDALGDSAGKLAVVALRGAALVCARAMGEPPTCARVEVPCDE